MCFVTYNLEIKTADEDITCFKYVVKTSDDTYITPFVGMTVEIGKQYDVKDDNVEVNKYVTGKYDGLIQQRNKYEISKGVFHSYVKPDFITHAIHSMNPCTYMVKCIIPKGTVYLTNGYEYASKSIKYLKIINI